MLGTLALDDDEINEVVVPRAGESKKILLRVVTVGRDEGKALLGREWVLDSNKEWIVGKSQTMVLEENEGMMLLDYKYVSGRHARIIVKDSMSIELAELPDVRNGTKVKIEGLWRPVGTNSMVVYAGMHCRFADVEVAVVMIPSPTKVLVREAEEKPLERTPTLPGASGGFGATIFGEDEEEEIVFQKPANIHKPVAGIPAADPDLPPTGQFGGGEPTLGFEAEEPMTLAIGGAAEDEEGEPTEGGSDEEDAKKSNNNVSDVLEPTQPTEGFAAPPSVIEKTLILDKQEEATQPNAKEFPTQAWFEDEGEVPTSAAPLVPAVFLGTATQTPIVGPPQQQNLDVDDEFDFMAEASPPRVMSAMVTASQRIMPPDGEEEEEQEQEKETKEALVAVPGRVVEGSDDELNTQGGVVNFVLPERQVSSLEKLDKKALQEKLRGWGLSVTGTRSEMLERIKTYRAAEEERPTEKDELESDKLAAAPEVLTVQELKAELKKLSLSTAGAKAELLARLAAARERAERASNPAQAPSGPTRAAASAQTAVKTATSRSPRGRASLEDELDLEEENTPAKRPKKKESEDLKVLPVAKKTTPEPTKKTAPKKKEKSADEKDVDLEEEKREKKGVKKQGSDDDELDLEEEKELPKPREVVAVPAAKKTKKKGSEDDLELEEEKEAPKVSVAAKKTAPDAKKKKESEEEEGEKKTRKKGSAKKSAPVKKAPKRNPAKEKAKADEEEEPVAPLKRGRGASSKRSKKESDEEMEEDSPAPAKRGRPTKTKQKEEEKEESEVERAFWYWACDETGPKSHWKLYDAAAAQKIERDFKGGKFKSTIGGSRWVDLNDMVQRVQGEPTKRRPVLRSMKELRGKDLKREEEAENDNDDDDDGDDEEKRNEGEKPKRGKKSEPTTAKASELKRRKTAEVKAVAAEPKKKEEKGKSAVVKKRDRNEEEEEEEEAVGKVVVASTGIKDEKELAKINKLEGLGAEMTEDVSKCTHLVTAGKILRTVKMLTAICAGCENVVTFDWVTESLRAGKLLPAQQWAVQDAETEKKWQFRLAASLERAREARLFAGMTFFCTENSAPPPDQLKEIIESGGGTVKTALPAKSAGDAKLIIVSCEKDKSFCEKLKARFPRIHVPELILSGVLQQHIDLNKHLLH